MGSEPVPLTVVATEAEAEMIRGLLATEGIESMHRPTNFGAGATVAVALPGAAAAARRKASAASRN